MTSLRRATLIALLALVSVPAWATTRGPDARGYTGTDTAVFSFVDAAGPGGGASLLSGVDDGTAALTLPFAFQFYGQSYGMVCVSANGAMYFITTPTACAGFNDFANTDLTATSPPNDPPGVFPFWSDLTFQVPGAGAVVYQTHGAPGSRRFVVQWQNAYPQGSANPVTFQVVLSEAGNTILFQYKTVDLGPGNAATNGGQATIGIRNAAALVTNEQIAWSFGAPVVGDSSVLLFSADSTAPTITASATPSLLSPPNNNPRLVTVTGSITDAGSGVNLGSAGFTVADEYGEAQPNGSILVEANGTYSVTLSLIAARHGQDKNGRTYTIVVRASDLGGNQGSASVVVTVPHDIGGGKDKGDDNDDDD